MLTGHFISLCNADGSWCNCLQQGARSDGKRFVWNSLDLLPAGSWYSSPLQLIPELLAALHVLSPGTGDQLLPSKQLDPSLSMSSEDFEF